MEEYAIGDSVTSIGGFFIEGIVEEVRGDVLTIRWKKDVRLGEIDVLQIRNKSIVRKL